MRYSILLLSVLLVGCADNAALSRPAEESNLPFGSTNVESEGNGWYSFRWDNQCFLTNQNGHAMSNNFDRVLTRIDCKPEIAP